MCLFYIVVILFYISFVFFTENIIFSFCWHPLLLCNYKGLLKSCSSLTCTSFTDELKKKFVDFEEFAKENFESKSCGNCQKSYSTKHSSEGQACIHERTIPFRCKRCGKSFGNSGNLKQHIL